MRMLTQQRREKILSSVFEAGHVTVEGLAASLGASMSTVRRDLRALAAANCVKLVYGGALSIPRYDLSFRAKSMCNVESKRIIGLLASQLVKDGDVIFLDAATTCFQMAAFLKRKRGITLITYSPRLVLELDEPGMNVILVGGKYRPDILDAVGPMAVMCIGQFHGYTAFLGADGVSMDFGAAVTDLESAHVGSAAARNASSVVLLVDGTKFLRRSFFKVAGFEKISCVVTDRPPSREWVEFLADRNIRVITPDASTKPAIGYGGGVAGSRRAR